MTVVGAIPPNRYGNLPLIGGYGPAWVAESYLVPAGYVLAVASDGANGQRNPVACREHTRSDYRGLRTIPGPNGGYPLQESYFQRTWGTGIRQRGAAAVMQITACAYAVPAAYQAVVA